MTRKRAAAAPPAHEAAPAQSLFAPHGRGDPDAIEQRRREIYRATFSTPIGRECLADIIVSCGLTAADPPLERDIANHRAGARWFGGEIAKLAGIGERALARAVMTDNLEDGFDVQT